MYGNPVIWGDGEPQITLQGTNISPKTGILKMIFLFPRWDMLIPWRVIGATILHFSDGRCVLHNFSATEVISGMIPMIGSTTPIEKLPSQDLCAEHPSHENAEYMYCLTSKREFSWELRQKRSLFSKEISHKFCVS